MAEFDRFSDDYTQILDASVAFSGDGAADFAEAKARALAALAGPGFQGKVLDFGCGVGLLSRFLAVHLPEAQLHGYDPSAQSVAGVPEALRAAGRFTAELGALDADYDWIAVSNVLHHVPPAERVATAAELAARLRPGGRVAVFEHNPWNPLTRWVVAHCPFDGDAVLLRRAEVCGLLAGAGLSVVRSDFVLFFPRALRALRPLEAGLGWCPLGAQHLVVAEKAGRGRGPA